MRYVYIKDGDALDEVRRVVTKSETARSGTDVFVADFIESHAKDKILVLGRSEPREKFFSENVHAQSFPARNGGPIWRAFKRAWSAFRIGIEILRWRPDRVLCGCTGELLWVSALATKLSGAAMVQAHHNEVQNRTGLGWVISALDKASMRACVGAACHGPFLAAQLRSLDVFGHNIQVFEVDLPSFVAYLTSATPPEGLTEFAARFDSVFLYVGRMQSNKGIFDLLEAVCELPESACLKVGVVYVGGGQDLELLRTRVENRRAQSNVLILGQVHHSKLPAVMRLSTAVITPTRPEFPEGRCMVVLESLVLGIPVIAPNSGPFPYAIQHDVDGILFEPGNKTSLRVCLLKMIEDRDYVMKLRNGAQATGHQMAAASVSTFSAAIDAAFATTAESS